MFFLKRKAKLVFCGDCRFRKSPGGYTAGHNYTMEELVCWSPSEAIMTKNFYNANSTSITKCSEKNRDNNCKHFRYTEQR